MKFNFFVSVNANCISPFWAVGVAFAVPFPGSKSSVLISFLIAILNTSTLPLPSFLLLFIFCSVLRQYIYERFKPPDSMIPPSLNHRESPLPREDHMVNINRFTPSNTQSNLSSNHSLLFSNPSYTPPLPSTASTSAFSSHADDESSDEASKDTTHLISSASSISNMPNLLSSTSGHRQISQFQGQMQAQTKTHKCTSSTSSKSAGILESASPRILSLNEFLYQKGFLNGVSSDVTIVCFGREYHLHKLILSRSSFFASLVSAEWATDHQDTSGPQKRLIDFGNDENVTQQAFELALARLYGHEDHNKEKRHVTNLLAVASFLDLPEIVEYCVSEIVKSIDVHNIASLLHFATKYEYGDASREIINSCKTFLCTEGYEFPREVWGGIPNEIAADVITADGFFVPTEWDRVQFMVLLYRYKVNLFRKARGGKKRLTKDQAEELQPLRDALTNRLHFCHLSYAQLEMLENLKDHRGGLLIKRESLRNALWLQTGLRHKVVNAKVDQQELNLTRAFNFRRKVFVNKHFQGREKDLEEDEEDNDAVPEVGSNRSSLNAERFPDASAALEKKNKDGETDSVRDATSESESEDSEEYEDDEDDGSSMYNESAQIYYPIPTDYNGLDSQEHKVSTTEIANVTKYPPFRFSVKFDDVTKLKVEKRVYSQTYWYAGSYWNIYIQKVQHKKGHQLGVYLHRGKLDSNTQSSNLRQDERLALFDLNEDEDGSLSIQPGSSPLTSPRRSRPLDLVAHSTNNLDGLTFDLATGTGGSLLDGAVPWMDGDGSTNRTGSPLGGNDNTGLYEDALRLRLDHSPPPHDLEWTPPSPPFEGGAALAAASIAAEAAAQGAASADIVAMFSSPQAPTNSGTGVSNLGRSGSNRKSGGANSANNSAHEAARPEYFDTRRVIQAYFEIYTPPRKKGSEMTCFSSSPDSFKFAQSWGWKSSPLCAAAEEMMRGGRHLKNNDPPGLRFMIVVGLV